MPLCVQYLVRTHTLCASHCSVGLFVTVAQLVRADWFRVLPRNSEQGTRGQSKHTDAQRRSRGVSLLQSQQSGPQMRLTTHFWEIPLSPSLASALHGEPQQKAPVPDPGPFPCPLPPRATLLCSHRSHRRTQEGGGSLLPRGATSQSPCARLGFSQSLGSKCVGSFPSFLLNPAGGLTTKQE